MQFIGEAKKRAALVSFNIEGLHPYDIGVLLDKMGIAIRTGHHCAQPIMERYNIPGTVRMSFGVYNTKEEIDSFRKELKPVEQQILSERILSETPRALQEIGDDQNITREAIRQTEQRILNKFKIYIAKNVPDFSA